MKLAAIQMFMVCLAGLLGVGDGFGLKLADPPYVEPTGLQARIDSATSTLQSGGATVGLVVIDRADNNNVITGSNTNDAHARMRQPGFTKMMTVLYIAKKDPRAFTTMSSDIAAVVQMDSSLSMDRLWNKYGKEKIIDGFSQMYDLQETKSNASWSRVETSAIDMARAYQRFITDPGISWGFKRGLMNRMAKGAENVGGFNQKWGVPAALPDDDTAWKNSWVLRAPDANPIRGTSGIVDGTRYIIVATANINKTGQLGATDNDANRAMTTMISTIVNNGTLLSNTEVPDKLTDQFKERIKNLDKSLG